MSRLGGVILAGGLGRRMHPLTVDCPKPLLPVGPSTIIEHQIAKLIAADVDRVVLSTGYRHADFDDLVARLRRRGVDLTTIAEGTPLGTGGAVREALRILSDVEAVVVLNGDLLSGHALGAQVGHLRGAPAEVVGVIHVREVADAQSYGSVLVDEGKRITEFVEKSPAPPSHTVNAGTYVVRPRLLDDLPAAGAVSLEREVFPALTRRGALLAHDETAYFLDVGSPTSLVTANRDLVLGRWHGPATETDQTDRDQSHPEALVLPGSRIHPSAQLGEGTVVHAGAVVASDAILMSTLVLADARVSARAHLVRSVVGRRAQVGESTRLVDCVLGSDATVPDGYQAVGLSFPQAG